MKTEELKEMLKKDKNNLNIEHNRRRLILLAVIKANYKLEVAYDLNAPYDLLYKSYTRKFYRYCLGGLDKLRKCAEKIKREEKKLRKLKP